MSLQWIHPGTAVFEWELMSTQTKLSEHRVTAVVLHSEKLQDMITFPRLHMSCCLASICRTGGTTAEGSDFAVGKPALRTCWPGGVPFRTAKEGLDAAGTGGYTLMAWYITN
jgi:hypothetical protein